MVTVKLKFENVARLKVNKVMGEGRGCMLRFNRANEILQLDLPEDAELTTGETTTDELRVDGSFDPGVEVEVSRSP